MSEIKGSSSFGLDKDCISGRPIDQIQQFMDLDSYVRQLTPSEIIKSVPTEEECIKLKDQLKMLLKYVSDARPLGSNENYSQDSVNKTFSLISNTFILIDKFVSSTAPSKIIKSARRGLIRELAKKYKLGNVDREDEFVRLMDDLIASSKDAIADVKIASTLPEDITPEDLAKELKRKTESNALDAGKQLKIEELQQKLQKISEKLKNKETQYMELLREHENVVNNYEYRIQELQSRIMSPENMQAITQCNAIGLHGAQIENLKADVTAVQLENNDLRSRLEKIKKKYMIAKSSLVDMEEKCSQLQDMIEKGKDSGFGQRKELAEVNEKLEASIADAEQLRKKLQKSESIRESYINVIDELSNQFKQQAEDLEAESSNRTALIIAVQRLSAVNLSLEKTLEEEVQKNRKLKDEKDLIKQQLSPQQSNGSVLVRSLELLDAINEVTHAAGKGLDPAIRTIMDSSDQSLQEKIIHIVTYLVNNQTTKSDVNPEHEGVDVEMLESALRSLLKFIVKLANSGDILMWTPNLETKEEARARILRECARVQKFINENTKSLMNEGEGFFDFLFLDTNVTTFQQKMIEYLDKYRDLETKEAKEMYNLLALSIAANDILRKFANEAKIQVANQAHDIKAMRNEAALACREIEGQYYDQIIDYQNQIRNLEERNVQLMSSMARVKSAIQHNQSNTTINGESATDYRDILDCVNGVTTHLPEFSRDDYVKQLEQIVEDRTNELNQERDNCSRIQSRMLDEIEKLKIQLNQEELNRKSNEDKALQQIESIKNALTESEIYSKKLISDKNALEKKMRSMIEEHASDTSELRKQCLMYQDKIASMKDSYSSDINSLSKENSQLMQSLEELKLCNNKQVSVLRDKMKKKLARVLSKLEEEESNYKNAKIEKETVEMSLKSRIEKLEFQSKSLRDELNQAKVQIKEAEEESNRLMIENKMLNTKLISKEEKIKHDRSVYESQLQLKIFAIETGAQAKYDSLRIENNIKLDNFLTDIIAMLQGYISLENPHPDMENIKTIIGAVCQKLQTIDEITLAYERSRSDLNNIRNILGISKNAKIVSAATEIVKRNKDLASELSKLTEDNSKMKREVISVRSLGQQYKVNLEWEEWARRLHLLVCDGYRSITTMKEIRFALEEILLANAHNRLVTRRLDCLRAEKLLILRGAQSVQRIDMPEEFRHLVVVMRCLQRLKIMSGHLSTSLSLETANIRDYRPLSNVRINSSPSDKKPIFSKFVVNNSHNSSVVSENSSVISEI